MTRKCPRCGVEMAESFRFCGGCGAPLADAPAEAGKDRRDEAPVGSEGEGGSGWPRGGMGAGLAILLAVALSVIIGVAALAGRGGNESGGGNPPPAVTAAPIAP